MHFNTIKIRNDYALTLILFMFSLYSVRILGPVTVADLGMCSFIVLSLFFYARVSINKLFIYYLFWSFFVLLMVFYYIDFHFFSFEKFISTYSRIFISILSMMFTPLWLRDKNGLIFINAMKNIFLFLIISQFLVIIIYYLGFDSVFNLIQHGDQSNRGDWLNVYSYTTYLRFGGLFEEPSWYSWFFIFIMGILVYSEKIKKQKLISKKLLILSFFAILFTFSLAGIISFIFLIIIRNSNRSVLKAILVAIFSIFLFFFLMYFFNDSFFDRLYAVATGSDGSSNNRIIGSISRTIMSLYESPFGFGIGNSISGIDFYSEKFGINIESSVSTQNGFSEAIISCGIILGIAYLMPIFYLIFGKYSLVLFITISLVFFTTSSIFISPMWFLISAAIFLKKYMINGQ